MLSSASDILQTASTQRPRRGSTRDQGETQQGQDFSTLIDSNTSADKTASHASATDQSERRAAENRTSRADRSGNIQADKGQNRREQAQQARAARNRDDHNREISAQRQSARDKDAQVADHLVKIDTRHAAAQDTSDDGARGTADADQTPDHTTSLDTDETSSAMAVAVAVNPDLALSGAADVSAAESSDAAIADALSAKSANLQASVAQLAGEIAAQDAAISDDAAQNGATQDSAAQPATEAADAPSDGEPAAETAKAAANAASEVAARDRNDTMRANTASADQDAFEQVAIGAASRRNTSAQAELQTDAANRPAKTDDARAADEQLPATGKAGQTSAAAIINADAATGARNGRGARNGEINRAERAARSETAAIRSDNAARADTDIASTIEAATDQKSLDAKDAASTARAPMPGAPHLAAERFEAANHALALQAALADSGATQAQSSFANQASGLGLTGTQHQPILQNIALFDAQATGGQPGGQTSGQAVAVSGLATEIVARSRDGSNRFEIRLDPAELGRIDVRLDVDKHGNVSSRLIVERTETLDMLRRDAAGLERALQDAGLKTSDNGLQFSLRDQNSSRQQDDQGQNQRHARLIIADDDKLAAGSAGQTYGRMLGNASGLDIRV